MDWILPDGKTALHERAEFVFSGDATPRTIQQTTTLTALDDPVVFADAKDGLFGMRVTRELEQPVPATWLALHTDADGRVSAEKTVDNDGVTGSYTSSEGKHGDDVWGTRGRWVMLSGRVGDEPITIAMIDHPKNPGYPTYWHARGYGLFAANPLGAKAFSNGKDAMNFTIAPHASTTFRYRVLILEGAASPGRIEKEFMDFSKGRTHRRNRRGGDDSASHDWGLEVRAPCHASCRRQSGALRAATVNAAELMGWQNDVGAIETGKYADLIAVEGDPLIDISVLQRVNFVMKGGTNIKDDISH